MDNMSFDDTLKVNMVEIIGADGNLVNPNSFNIPKYTQVLATYTDITFTEVYVFKNGATTVGTLTVIYVDASKSKLVSATLT